MLAIVMLFLSDWWMSPDQAGDFPDHLSHRLPMHSMIFGFVATTFPSAELLAQGSTLVFCVRGEREADRAFHRRRAAGRLCR